MRSLAPFHRLAFFALLLAAADGLWAQPGRALQEASAQLLSARAYSWRESRQSVFNTRKSSTPYGVGRTEIQGFTLATIIEPKNVRAAFYGPRTAFFTKDGWRRTADFTDEEIAEYFGVPPAMLERLPRFADSKRKYTHAFLHQILPWMVELGTNLREEEDGAIVGDLKDDQLEMFISSGIPPRVRPVGPFGLPLPRPPRPGMKEESSTFRVWLAEGKVTRCVIDFSRSGVVTSGAHAGTAYSDQRVYIYDIFEIGPPGLEIGSDIEAVFNDVVTRREKP